MITPYRIPILRSSRAKRKVEALTRLLPNPVAFRNCSAIDIGGGDGTFATHFLDAIPSLSRYTILDSSKAAILKAKERLGHLVETVHCPLNIYDTNQQFDIVLAICSLEHCDDIESTIRSASSLLRTGGYFLGAHSNATSFYKFQRMLQSQFAPWPFGHQKEVTKSELSKLLAHHLDDIRITALHGDWDMPVWTLLDRFGHIFSRRWYRYHIFMGTKVHD